MTLPLLTVLVMLPISRYKPANPIVAKNGAECGFKRAVHVIILNGYAAPHLTKTILVSTSFRFSAF